MTPVVEAAFRREMRFLLETLFAAWEWPCDLTHCRITSASAYSIRTLLADIAYSSPLHKEAEELVRWADAAADGFGEWRRGQQARRAA